MPNARSKQIHRILCLSREDRAFVFVIGHLHFVKTYMRFNYA
jgi:hypothetical protein